MDAENMFNISVDLYKTMNKTYPKYKIPEYILHIMLKASKFIFKYTNIVKKKGSYYNMKRKLNIIHLYKSFNSICGHYSKMFVYNEFHSSYYGTFIDIPMLESLGRYKNINKWVKAIKYHDKKGYDKYIKPIIRYINKPKTINGTYSIKAFDINNGLDIFETASYNSDELKTLNEVISNYTQSFRVITGTDIAMIHIDRYIDFIPLRNAINIIKKAELPNINYPNEFYNNDNIINDEIRKAYFFRQFEKCRILYNITMVTFNNCLLYKQKICDSLFTSYHDRIKIEGHIFKQVDLYNGMPFLNISEASSKNVNDDVDTFFDLLQNMFINEEDVIYFIKYLAWIIQHPGQQSEVVPVLHTSKNTSHIIKHITKIFQNYAYKTSKSIYDKMKHNNSLHELLCKMIVIIDDDLPLYEDMSNFSTKYQTSTKNYKPNKEFETFVKKDSHINIKVKGSKTLQIKNINNYIIISSDIYSYIMKSKVKHSYIKDLKEKLYPLLEESKNIKYFIPRLCLSNICNDIKYHSIKSNFHDFYRELTLRFVRMSLNGFDINKVPTFEYNKHIYRTPFHKMNPINVLIGVLMNLNLLYDKFPIRLIRRIIYEITSVQSYKLLSDVLLCDMKELTFEGERVFSYLFTKFRYVDCEKIMSKLNIYFEPAGYSSFNKFLHTYEHYGINSNNNLDFLRSDKSEKFIKLNVNRLQQLESLKINIFTSITKMIVSSEPIFSSEPIVSSEPNITIEMQDDSIVIRLNSKKTLNTY